jgi:hypothetical protein
MPRPRSENTLTPARRAFLASATTHPVLRSPTGIYECAGSAIAFASGEAMVRSNLLEPILQGDYIAEDWNDTRLIGYRYRITAAGRAAASNTEGN